MAHTCVDLQIVTSASTDLQDYTYYFVPAPWLSVKLLRLLQCYPPPGMVERRPLRRLASALGGGVFHLVSLKALSWCWPLSCGSSAVHPCILALPEQLVESRHCGYNPESALLSCSFRSVQVAETLLK